MTHYTPFSICFLPISYLVSTIYVTFQQLVMYATMYNRYSTVFLKINGGLLKGEIEKCIQNLHDVGFRVRAVVSDNHSSNVAAFNSLFAEYGRDNDSLRIWIAEKPIYLFYDTVHLVKNLRNNLLARKQLLFPPFICDDMEQKLKIARGGIS